MNPVASNPERWTVENIESIAGASNHICVWKSNGLEMVTLSVNNSRNCASDAGGKDGKVRPRSRDASAVIARSPPDAPITNTRRPRRGPPEWNTLRVSHNVDSESQRAIPVCLQNES